MKLSNHTQSVSRTLKGEFPMLAYGQHDDIEFVRVPEVKSAKKKVSK